MTLKDLKDAVSNIFSSLISTPSVGINLPNMNVPVTQIPQAANTFVRQTIPNAVNTYYNQTLPSVNRFLQTQIQQIPTPKMPTWQPATFLQAPPAINLNPLPFVKNMASNIVEKATGQNPDDKELARLEFKRNRSPYEEYRYNQLSKQRALDQAIMMSAGPLAKGRGMTASLDELTQGAMGRIEEQNFLKSTEAYTQRQASELAGKAEYLMSEGKGIFDDIFKRLIGKLDAAKTTAMEYGQKLKVLPKEAEPMEVIKAIQNPSKAPENVKPYIEAFRKLDDEVFTAAKEAGIDINYLRNHISQFWKNPYGEVLEKYQTFKSRYGLASSRKIPSYEEGIAMNLKPLYDNPAQIMYEQVKRLEQVKAYLDAFKELRREGFIVPASIGSRTPGFKQIDAIGFPVSKSSVGSTKTYIGKWYAPNLIADILNRVYSPTTANKAFSILGNVSSTLQDIHLAGGVAGTPLNFWTAAQILFKEIPAGKVITPLKALYKSLVPGAANKYFEESAPVIKEMQLQNIPVNTSWNVESLAGKNILDNLGSLQLRTAWNKLFNNPTFQKFGSMLQIETYKSIKDNAVNGRFLFLNGIRTKVGEEEAQKIAADAVKKFYGVLTSEKAVLADPTIESLKKTFFFAPKYRASVWDFLVNTLKGIANPLSPSNELNLRWLGGMVLTYIVYDKVNYALNGKHMNENPPGTEDKLLIPTGKYTIGVPFGSSILTIPRMFYRMGGDLARGDIKEAGKELTTGVSSLFQPVLEAKNNENYYGAKIYNDNDSPSERYKKILLHLAKGYNHPYIAAVISKLTTDKPDYQIVSEALEIPFRYYESKNLDAKFYFANRDEALRKLSEHDRQVYDTLHSSGLVDDDGLPVYDPRSGMANALLRLANPEVIRAEGVTAIQTSQKTGEMLDPFYLLSPEQQQVVLILKTFYPGDNTKTQITNQNIDWLKPYWAERDKYIAHLKETGAIKETENSFYADKPQVTTDLQSKLDYYFSLPSGTGQRTRYINANPELQQYFDANKEWTNKARITLGLPELAPFVPYAKKPFSTKIRKMAIKKPKKIKLTAAKGIRIAKAKQVPKIKIGKFKSLYSSNLSHLKTKNIKIKGLPIRKLV